ncbi:MAG: hypothetical protein IH588_05315 [Anaerolineales bacterium]|nr:hypothetical protein [Anaerolineales bacterium]
MSQSEDPIIPTELPSRPREEIRNRRRRATRRSSIPRDADGQATLISDLSRRAYPSFELFIFSLVCGAILGLGFLLDSQTVLLLGILVAPLMTPWVGFLLAILTGSPRFLFETLMALLISGVLVFIGGLLTGFAARLFMPMTLTNVFVHSRLWLPALVVLAIGAVTLVASFARSEAKPFLPSVLIAYVFYLPISAGGFGLGSGLQGVWPQGLLVFLTHFALASALGLITLYALRLRPSLGGIIFSGIALLLFAGILFSFMGSGFPPVEAAIVATSTPTTEPSPLPSPTSSLTPTATNTVRPSSTSAPRTPTNSATPDGTITVTVTGKTPTPVPLTISVTLPATETPTITLTIPTTPTYAKIAANEGGGANLRQTPGGKYIMTLLNGTIVETYSDFREVNGVTWVHVFVTVNGQRLEGWLLESVIAYATPAPNFEPTSTPTFGVTPSP